MLSDDFIAERLRPDVCKMVLVLDAVDSQPVPFDLLLQPQMRLVDVFHFAVCMSMKNVPCSSLRQCSTQASLQNPSHTSCSGPLSLLTLPMPLH